MKPRGNDPMRPSTPAPRTSWWATKEAQESPEVFYALDKREAERMNGGTSAEELAQARREKGSHE